MDLVRRAEKAAHEQQLVSQRRRHLPPAEQPKLFGVDSLINELVRLLSDPTGASFISLEGLGGIGKTTLAQAVAYRMAEQTYFSDILWVHAKPQQINERGEIKLLSESTLTMEGIFSHLAAQLGLAEFSGMSMRDIQVRLQAIWANHPYLIVIDNLETIEETSELLPTFSSLAGQSRFLLTSRHTLR
ncbi:MAG: NB-ARC domain-containing protein [Chloroflexi bacterium]|nr:NB-ARC domain-containing protein [Chloroflexota bacterium]